MQLLGGLGARFLLLLPLVQSLYRQLHWVGVGGIRLEIDIQAADHQYGFVRTSTGYERTCCASCYLQLRLPICKMRGNLGTCR